MKKIITAIIALILLLCAVGCKEETISAKTFEKNGIRLTLDETFEEISSENYTACYQSSDDMAVFCVKCPESSYEGYSLYDFAGGLRDSKSSRNPTELARYSKYFAFEYTSTNPDTNDDYTYYTAVYKTDGAFWIVQCSCLASLFEDYRASVKSWADSIEFY